MLEGLFKKAKVVDVKTPRRFQAPITFVAARVTHRGVGYDGIEFEMCQRKYASVLHRGVGYGGMDEL